MKHLKIENNKGSFLREGTEWIEINKMNKDDLYSLVRKAVEETDFMMDSFDENRLRNPAHKSIYSHIYRQLFDINKRRDEFIEEQHNLYKEAYDKYCI